MNSIIKNSKYFIPIVWFLCLALTYFGKIENMIKFGHYKLFVSEFLLWLLFGVVFNYLYYLSLNNNKGQVLFVVFLKLLFISSCVTIALWLALYFPVTYFTEMAWIEMLKMSNIFLTFYTNCFVLSVWYFFYSNMEFLEKVNNFDKEKLLLESTLKESQINALKGQINPHFMFNSLNNIRGLILENPMKSREMITRLSEMLRYSLTKSEINTIALEEEIEMVENFIAISKIQLEDRLQFISEIEEETLKLPIPPMVIQMLIENAIKHGISQLKHGGILLLNIKKENTDLHIQVKNTGNLSQQTGTTQLGLKNIQRRLQLIYGESATFSLNEVENEVIAKITLPIS
ncbi:histidine kinase [Flavobacterium tiangeerense]|uniref:Histidine kinase n=1 Tax=Flavobacterium tiangeerense TaxID=459471 RepID=A0ABY3FM20_9FLAO|nr:histidine kinase [Flavobacterium tiangeerense]TWI02245.1 histidine kinase [Flavobacterium tiangeerense]